MIDRTVKFPETAVAASRSPRMPRVRGRTPTASWPVRSSPGDRWSTAVTAAGDRGRRQREPPVPRSRLDYFEGPSTCCSADRHAPAGRHRDGPGSVTDDFIAHTKRRATTPTSTRPRVPGRRGDPARPEGGPAAAGRRGRGRRGPGPARGARPAVRPAAAVPGLQGGGETVRADGGEEAHAVPEIGRGGTASRRCCPEVLLGIDADRARRAGGIGVPPGQAPTVGWTTCTRRRSACGSRRRVLVRAACGDRRAGDVSPQLADDSARRADRGRGTRPRAARAVPLAEDGRARPGRAARQS